MIKIIFEAHSTTLDNEAKLSSGWNDVDLSDLGVKQSQELKDRYKDVAIDVIITSDLQRAVKTAVPLASLNHTPIYTDVRLRECNYGDLTQSPSKVVEEEKPNRIDTPFPNGESYNDCVERVVDFLDWLKTNFDGKTVMIIGHRATQYSLDFHLKGLSLIDVVSKKFTWQPGWEYELK